MLRRELGIAMRAPVTWVVAAIAALVVGHGFALAVDLFSATSRAALAGTLMHRELDPLAGIVRPTLGGAQLASSLLVPVIAARVLAVEKERNTFGALALAVGGTTRVVLWKLVAALAAGLVLLAAPVLLFAAYEAMGGELDLLEVGIATLGHLFHVTLIASFSVAAAAWTRTVAQATALAIVVSLVSWALDAGEGFAALAWLGPAEAASVSRQLAPFEAGILDEGALLWFAVATGAAIAAAIVGARFDLGPAQRAVTGTTIAAAAVLGILASTRLHRGHDWTEGARASLPPAAVIGLRALPGEIEVVAWLDRDDSRRRQLERDALAKLRLARSDVRITWPLDNTRTTLDHDEGYGRIVVRAAGGTRETRSTSRREIVSLVFEAAGQTMPDWSQAAYPGHPLIVEGWRRSLARTIAYFLLPGALLALGAWIRRRPRRHS